MPIIRCYFKSEQEVRIQLDLRMSTPPDSSATSEIIRPTLKQIETTAGELWGHNQSVAALIEARDALRMRDPNYDLQRVLRNLERALYAIKDAEKLRHGVDYCLPECTKECPPTAVICYWEVDIPQTGPLAIQDGNVSSGYVTPWGQ